MLLCLHQIRKPNPIQTIHILLLLLFFLISRVLYSKRRALTYLFLFFKFVFFFFILISLIHHPRKFDFDLVFLFVYFNSIGLLSLNHDGTLLTVIASEKEIKKKIRTDVHHFDIQSNTMSRIINKIMTVSSLWLRKRKLLFFEKEKEKECNSDSYLLFRSDLIKFLLFFFCCYLFF